VFGKALDLSNLQVFGCQVFSRTDKSKQFKLGHKSSEGIFVGYAFDCSACLIFNPNTRSITRTYSVVFNEQWEPNRQGKSNKINNNEIEIKFTKTQNFAHFGGVSNNGTHAADVSSAERGKATPLKFSSDIHRIYSDFRFY